MIAINQWSFIIKINVC